VERDDALLVSRAVDGALPEEFRGWPTRFGWDAVPESHHVTVTVLGDWLHDRLGFDPRHRISTESWLVTPQQILLEVTRGAVFHDDSGELTAAREALAWYPDEVWYWLLACQWRRIDEEEPFMGRTAEAGDELGSRVLASRLVRDVIRLCFLQERRYAPYSKWLGSAFRDLEAHETLRGPLLDLLVARDYKTREALHVAVVEALAARHNALGATLPVDESVGLLPRAAYRVLGSGRFVDACLARVSDPWLRSLPLTGGIDQFVDSTDVLSNTEAFPKVASLFEAWGLRGTP
jgi:hypothetical protein